MDATATAANASGQDRKIDVRAWLGRARDTLDDYGTGAWIGATVLSFIVFAPIGIALLVYMFWSGRMGCRGKWRRNGMRGRSFSMGSTGNAAFDAYRDETIQRLEDERKAFEEFLERLRKAKDQAEFDQFMTERGSAGGPTPPQAPAQ